MCVSSCTGATLVSVLSQFSVYVLPKGALAFLLCIFHLLLLSKSSLALASVPKWLEHQPTHGSVTGLFGKNILQGRLTKQPTKHFSSVSLAEHSLDHKDWTVESVTDVIPALVKAEN